MSGLVKAIIVHGTKGAPSGNWFPWLKKQLYQEGMDVSCPAFPTPEGQTFASWREAFRREIDRPEDDIILIGHSVGAPFVLRMAEESNAPYRAVFVVCPFARTLGVEEFDSLNASFIDHTFDWSRIKKGARSIGCFAGTDDPYVPLDYSADVACKTDADFVTIVNGGHLNAEFGFTEFPQLLAKIKRVLDE